MNRNEKLAEAAYDAMYEAKSYAVKDCAVEPPAKPVRSIILSFSELKNTKQRCQCGLAKSSKRA